MPPQTDPTKPHYNPYITTDYTEVNTTLEVNDGRVANMSGAVAPAPVITSFVSWGRYQPLSGTTSATQRFKQAPSPAPKSMPLNTFFRHNAIEGTPPPSASTPGQTLQIPFDWMVLLDRQLTSPMELLHVSGFKPHELTQQFVDVNANKFAHRVPWYDSRPASEMGEARDRCGGEFDCASRERARRFESTEDPVRCAYG
jgi:hypothetical protein